MGVIVMVLHTFATKCMPLCFLMLYILKGELTLVVIYIHIRSQCIRNFSEFIYGNQMPASQLYVYVDIQGNERTFIR